MPPRASLHVSACAHSPFASPKNVEQEVELLGLRPFMSEVYRSCSVALCSARNDLHSHQQISTWLRVYVLRFIHFFKSDKYKMVSHYSLFSISLVY